MKSIFTFILLLVVATTSSFGQITNLDRYLLSADKLVVRSGPGPNYNEIAEVPKGTQVYVISSGYGDYSTIQYKSLNGFVLTRLLIQDNSLAEAERAAKDAEAKKAAAKAAAEAAIAQAEAAKKAAEEAARKAIAQAEAMKRQAEAEAAAASAAALAAKQNKTAQEQRRLKELEETQRALIEANKRAEQSGSIAAAPIESVTSSGGKNSRNNVSSSSKLTKENKFSAWKKKTYKSGATPTSFSNYKGKYDYKLDNYLKIAVGKNTDVVVKLVKMGKTKAQDETVRIVYINSGNTQYIRNIPEGQYYCVIAYGKEWKENGPGQGTFTINALYEKGQDILDFTTVKTAQGINMPDRKSVV